MTQARSHEQNIENLASIFRESPDILKALLDSYSTSSIGMITPLFTLAARHLTAGKTVYDSGLLSDPEFQKDILARPELLDFLRTNPMTLLDATATFYQHQGPFTEGSILDLNARKKLAAGLGDERSLQSIVSLAHNTLDMMKAPDDTTYYLYLTSLVRGFMSMPQITEYLKQNNTKIANYVCNQYSHYGLFDAIKLFTSESVPNGVLDNIVSALTQNDLDKKLNPEQMQEAVQELLQPRYRATKALGFSNHTSHTVAMAQNIMEIYGRHISAQSEKINVAQGFTEALFSEPKHIVESNILDGIGAYFVKNDAKPIALSLLDFLERSQTVTSRLKNSAKSIQSVIRSAIEQNQITYTDITQGQLASVNNILSAIIPALLEDPKSLRAIVSPALDGKYDEMALSLFSLLQTNKSLQITLKHHRKELMSLLDTAAHRPEASDILKSYNLTPKETAKAMEILPILLDNHPENLHTTLMRFRENDYLGMAQELLKIPENPEVIKYLVENKNVFAKAIISQLPIKGENITLLTESFTTMFTTLLKEPKHLQDILTTISKSPQDILGLYNKLLLVSKAQPELKGAFSVFTEDLLYALPEIAQHDTIATKLQVLSTDAIDPKKLLTKPVLNLVLAMQEHLGEKEITEMVTAYNKGDYYALATPILKAMYHPTPKRIVENNIDAFKPIIDQAIDQLIPDKVKRIIDLRNYTQRALENPSTLLKMLDVASNSYRAGTTIWNSIPSRSDVINAVTPSLVSSALATVNAGFRGMLGYNTTKTPAVVGHPETEVIDPEIVKAAQAIAPDIDPAGKHLIATHLMNALSARKDDDVKISEILTPDTIKNLATLYKENKDDFALQTSTLIGAKYYQILDAKDQFFDAVEEQPPLVSTTAVSLTQIEALLDAHPATALKPAKSEEQDEIFHDALDTTDTPPIKSEEPTATTVIQDQAYQTADPSVKTREWKDYAIIGTIIKAWNNFKDKISTLFAKQEEKAQDHKTVETKASSAAKPTHAPDTLSAQPQPGAKKWTRQFESRVGNGHVESLTSKDDAPPKVRGG